MTNVTSQDDVSANTAKPAGTSTSASPPIVRGRLPEWSPVPLESEKRLDLHKNNWKAWSRFIKRVLGLSSGFLLYYLDGRIPCPSDDTSPEYSVWLSNDKKIRALCGHHAFGEDQQIIRNSTSAAAMWCTLKDRHENYYREPANQVLLLHKTIANHAVPSRPLPEQIREIEDVCESVMPLSADTLAVVLILRSLEHNFKPLVARLLDQHLYKPLTCDSIVRRLELEDLMQQWAVGEPSTSSSTTPVRSSNKATKCLTCQSTTHRTSTCFQPGGAMEGRRDEVLQSRRRRNRKGNRGQNAARSSASATGSRRLLHDPSGNAYMLEDGQLSRLSPAAPATSALDVTGFAVVDEDWRRLTNASTTSK